MAAAAAAAAFLLLVVPTFLSAAASPHISAVISQSGLDFVKDLLVSRAAEAIAPLEVPDIERSVSIPVIGTVDMVASGIVLDGLEVADSTAAVGDDGIVVAASLSSVNLTMRWSYSYSAWIVTISDSGNASIQVDGMDVGISMGIKNQNGSLKLFVIECGCNMSSLDISLNGGASWLYQGFVDGFSNHIRSSVQNAITSKIMEGASKLDSFLGSLPKKIDVDSVAAMNVTFVNDPLFKSSSVEFDIDGLFIPSGKTALLRHRHFGSAKYVPPLGSSSKMLWISLDEDVFNSASALYFKAGLLQRMVDKIPEQLLLNTATWRFLIPRLYQQYPNDGMLLNISATSPPSVRINVGRIDATVDLDVTVNVLDFDEIVPVACISVSVAVSGAAVVSGNNLAGRVELDYFSFTLKWSEVGKLHTFMIQSVMQILLKRLFVPYVNSYLTRGFPLPIIKGFSIRDAYILTSQSRIIVSSDVAFIGGHTSYQSQ
ncbi:putative BPI/LBP family protein At1g04970 [Oryza brachyantha]|uniref:Lipid-binding serum glycoprotein C-terminal domain-containing protein n=1 Tax=Oryza brachyantha TaxID=4533 RepID=J3MYK6_ORYBR|nr:putative BPI/LBP family protein At1g04970 [Oryza brachyantha]